MTHVHPAFRSSVFAALIGSACVVLIASLLLDGGKFARTTTISLSIVWAVNLVLIAMLQESPARAAVMVVRWGWLLAVLVPVTRILASTKI